MKKLFLALSVALAVAACSTPEQQKDQSAQENPASASTADAAANAPQSSGSAFDPAQLRGTYQLNFSNLLSQDTPENAEDSLVSQMAEVMIGMMQMTLIFEEEGQGKFKMGMGEMLQGLAEAFGTEVTEEDKAQLEEGKTFRWKYENGMILTNMDNNSDLQPLGRIINFQSYDSINLELDSDQGKPLKLQMIKQE